MAAHMPHPRRCSGDTGQAGAVRRAKPVRSGRSSRARRHEPLSGQLILPGLGHLQGPVPGGAPCTASGPGRGRPSRDTSVDTGHGGHGPGTYGFPPTRGPGPLPSRGEGGNPAPDRAGRPRPGSPHRFPDGMPLVHDADPRGAEPTGQVADVTGSPLPAAHPAGRGTDPTPAPRRPARSGPGADELGAPDQGTAGVTPIPEQHSHGADASDTRGVHTYGGDRPDGPPGALVRPGRPSGGGPSPAPTAPDVPGPENGPGTRNGAPSGASARLGRMCARGRASRRTERRCEGAGFRLPERRRSRRGTRCDMGMSTAEYALGTVSAVAFAGVLYVILTGGTVTEALTDIVVDALSSGM